MIKRIISIAAIVLVSIFAINLNTQAAVNSMASLDSKIAALEKLSKLDFTTMYSKTQLIGLKRDEFERASGNFKSNAEMTAIQLKGIKNELQNLDPKNDADKIINLYLNADNSIYDFNNKARAFVVGLEFIMPTLTYQKFTVKFYNYYNSLNLTN